MRVIHFQIWHSPFVWKWSLVAMGLLDSVGLFLWEQYGDFPLQCDTMLWSTLCPVYHPSIHPSAFYLLLCIQLGITATQRCSLEAWSATLDAQIKDQLCELKGQVGARVKLTQMAVAVLNQKPDPKLDQHGLLSVLDPPISTVLLWD